MGWQQLDVERLNLLVGLVSLVVSLAGALAWLCRRKGDADGYRQEQKYFHDLPSASSGTPMPKVKPPKISKSWRTGSQNIFIGMNAGDYIPPPSSFPPPPPPPPKGQGGSGRLSDYFVGVEELMKKGLSADEFDSACKKLHDTMLGRK